MNNNAKLWVEALRSGKYEQTRGTLHDKSGYCCLGVACEVFIENGGVLDVRGSVVNEGLFIYDDESARLPRAVQDWLGLQTNDGEFDYNALTSVNDSGVKFESIANLIESEPEGLFTQEDEAA